MMFKTNVIPTKAWMIHTDEGNEFYNNLTDIDRRAAEQNKLYRQRGLTKTCPIFKVTIDYEVY